MTTVTPREFLKDYKANYRAVGHDEAYRILRQRIVYRHGHAWFMARREKIEAEIAILEAHLEEK
jgi:hypothetical protein